jgi:hypothetical protein
LSNRKIDIGKDKPKEPPSPGDCLREATSAKPGEGMKGRGIKMVTIHPHPMHHIGCMTVLNLTWFRAGSLPSRERGNWIESISVFGSNLFLDTILELVIMNEAKGTTSLN